MDRLRITGFKGDRKKGVMIAQSSIHGSIHELEVPKYVLHWNYLEMADLCVF